VKVNTKPKTAKVTVKAKGVKPTGKVTFTIRGAGKRVTRTVKLNKSGVAKVKLPRYKRTGKVTVRVKYSGNAKVKAAQTKKTFKVVRR
jgi:hypothetical protein